MTVIFREDEYECDPNDLKSYPSIDGFITFTCPDPSIYCQSFPNSCPKKCLDKGICIDGKCVCIAGRSGPDCSIICNQQNCNSCDVAGNCLDLAPYQLQQCLLNYYGLNQGLFSSYWPDNILSFQVVPDPIFHDTKYMSGLSNFLQDWNRNRFLSQLYDNKF